MLLAPAFLLPPPTQECKQEPESQRQLDDQQHQLNQNFSRLLGITQVPNGRMRGDCPVGGGV
jgi:hypothetical protein